MNNHSVKISITFSDKTGLYQETISVILNVPNSWDEEEYIDEFIERRFKADYVNID